MPLNSLNNVNTRMWLCRDKLVLIWKNSVCTRMAFHIQSVSQLALQARRRARAQGRWGVWGASPWPPSPQTERWKQVCLCVNTAMMLLETQQAAITLLGRSPRGLILDFAHVEQGGETSSAGGIQSKKKKEGGKKKNSCVSSSWYTNERLLRGDALLTILCKAD